MAKQSDANAILDKLPDGVLIVSAGLQVQFASRAFLELTGWRREDVEGRALLDIVAQEDLLSLVGFEPVFGAAHTRDVTVVFMKPDATCLPLAVTSAKVEGESVTYLIARDSAKLQEELAATTRWAAEEQDRAAEISRARDLLTKTNSELLATQHVLEGALLQLRQEVAAREKLEEDLRLAQKLEAVGQLAAGVAHEINTPIQYIGDNVNFVDRAWQRVIEYARELQTLLLARAPRAAEVESELAALAKKVRLDYLKDQVPKAISSSRQGAEQISTIVRAMKAFASSDQSEKTYGDINEALRNTLIVAQNEYRSYATVETDLAELPPVLCYVGRLNQVFLNLIVNAAQAIAEAKRATPGVIRVRTRLDGDMVVITLADNGCGIPSAIQHRVFDQFFTTKEVGRGSGVGLSVARSLIVGAHGGTITFVSQVNLGTEFTIRLPVNGVRQS
jgi:signal transduction histidine kinase